jgi:hypothetical protein
MTALFGKGFQVASIKNEKRVEVIYWVAPSGESFSTPERPFDFANFDKKDQEWTACQEVPGNAEFIGNYPKPESISLS